MAKHLHSVLLVQSESALGPHATPHLIPCVQPALQADFQMKILERVSARRAALVLVSRLCLIVQTLQILCAVVTVLVLGAVGVPAANPVEVELAPGTTQSASHKRERERSAQTSMGHRNLRTATSTCVWRSAL